MKAGERYPTLGRWADLYCKDYPDTTFAQRERLIRVLDECVKAFEREGKK